MIFDELKYAEELIKNGFTKFMFAEITILAKYFRHMGLDESDIAENIFVLCEKHIGGFNRLSYEERIYSIIARTQKSELRLPKPIPITINEINKIRELKNYRHEKIIFTLLVLAKYYKITNPSKTVNTENKKYYYTIKFSSLLRAAHTSQKKDENIRHILYKGGYIVDTNILHNYLITFADMDDQSEPYVVVEDMENIIHYYPPYCGSCGKPIAKISNRQTICDDCWLDSRMI